MVNSWSRLTHVGDFRQEDGSVMGKADGVTKEVLSEEGVFWLRYGWKETGQMQTWSSRDTNKNISANSSEKAPARSITAEWEADLPRTAQGRFCAWRISYKVCILNTWSLPSHYCPGATRYTKLGPKVGDSSLKESERPQRKDLCILAFRIPQLMVVLCWITLK